MTPSLGYGKEGLRSESHRSEKFYEFVILLMGQHEYDVTFSNSCPTCGLNGKEGGGRGGFGWYEKGEVKTSAVELSDSGGL